MYISPDGRIAGNHYISNTKIRGKNSSSVFSPQYQVAAHDGSRRQHHLLAQMGTVFSRTLHHTDFFFLKRKVKTVRI